MHSLFLCRTLGMRPLFLMQGRAVRQEMSKQSYQVHNVLEASLRELFQLPRWHQVLSEGTRAIENTRNSRRFDICFALSQRFISWQACSRVPSGEKAQSLDFLGKEFRGMAFYFKDSDGSGPHSLLSGSEGLEFIQMSGRSGQRQSSIEEVAENLGFARRSLRWIEICSRFYEMIGVRTSIEHKHELERKMYHHKWYDPKGNIKQVFGTIIQSFKCSVKGEFIFDVELSPVSLQSLKPETSRTISITEQEAWAGYVSFEKECTQKVRSTNSLYRKYIVPIRVDCDTAITRFQAKGYELELKVDKSEICGAGKGLFVRCREVICRSRKSTCMELEAGELIDLGVYTPILESDLKRSCVSAVKAFIHDGKNRGWEFNYDGNKGCRDANLVLDVTDDVTGEIHPAASDCKIVFANETNGIDSPSLYCESDPEGSVHYYLGHEDPRGEPLKLPVDKWIELKVDYGPDYEGVRVSKNYARVTGNKLKELSLNDDKRDFFHAISNLEESVDFDACTAFLSSVSAIIWKHEKKRSLALRMLVTSLLLRHRLAVVAMNSRESWPAYTSKKLYEVSASLCARFGAQNLKEELFSNPRQSNDQLAADTLFLRSVVMYVTGFEGADECKNLDGSSLFLECIEHQWEGLSW